MLVAAGAAMAAGGSDHTITTVVSLLLAVMGIGTVALLVSQKAKTGSVVTTAGSSIGHMICVALSPVTGGTCGLGTSVSSTFNTGCVTVAGVQYCP